MAAESAITPNIRGMILEMLMFNQDRLMIIALIKKCDTNSMGGVWIKSWVRESRIPSTPKP